MSIKVEVISRRGYHLCEEVVETINKIQKELAFDFDIRYIDSDFALELRFGEEVPVTLINGARHDFLRIDSERFKREIIRQLP